jgi:Flp pilus assembly pilin Flp
MDALIENFCDGEIGAFALKCALIAVGISTVIIAVVSGVLI